MWSEILTNAGKLHLNTKWKKWIYVAGTHFEKETVDRRFFLEKYRSKVQREERAIGTGKPALTKASKDKSKLSCLLKL